MHGARLLIGCCALLAGGSASARDRILLAVPFDDADRSLHRSVEAALRDRARVEDVTATWRLLHPPAPLATGTLDADPPDGWPAPLGGDWRKGTAACRTFATPPFGPANAEAVRCGARLAEALWQRWLEHEAPELFLAVLVEAATEEEDARRLRIVAFRPGEPSQRTAERARVPADDVREAATMLALRLARGGGTKSPRMILSALPTPKRAVEPPLPVMTPSKLPRPCATALPERLALTPADARLSKMISALWTSSAASAPRRMPTPLECTLDHTLRPEELVHRRYFLGTATLRCGRARVVSKLQDPVESALEEALARSLVEQLLAARCAAAGP